MTAMPAAAPARAPARRRGHLRVVDAPPKRRRRVRLTVTGAVVATLTVVFGLVAFNVFLVQSQFELERLETQVEQQKQEFERLRLEAARLSAPERILRISRQELGMVDPSAITNLTAPSPEGSAEPFTDGSEAAREWAEVKPFLAAEP